MSTSSTLGFVQAGAVLGYQAQAALFATKRKIGDFIADVTIEETHQDDLEITDHPVDVNGKASDHSFRLPSVLTVKCGWSNTPTVSNFGKSLESAVTGSASGIKSIKAQLTGTGTGNPARDTYQNFLELQRSRALISVVTGKRKYDNMLIKSIHTQTDLNTENCLILTIVLREILIVSAVATTLAPNMISNDAAHHKNPDTTAPQVPSGSRALTPVKK